MIPVLICRYVCANGKKKDFISVPYEPKNEGYMKTLQRI